MLQGHTMRTAISLIILGLGLSLPATAAAGDRSQPSVKNPAKLRTLSMDAKELKALFNKHAGKPRLILLVSPT